MGQQKTKSFETDSLTEKRIIRQLALEWIQSRLPAGEVTFVDCLNVLSLLQNSTGNISKTELIFEIVFKQAQQLRKTSEWLAQELEFEALALVFGNRQELVRYYLHQSNPINDDALDVYNERFVRQINY